MSDTQKDAVEMLKYVLQTQPNLFIPVGANEARGKDVAVFCDAFIREFQRLQKQDTGQSQP
jgi:hypothetical protein